MRFWRQSETRAHRSDSEPPFWRRRLPELSCVVAVLAVYGRALRRYFTSEDFLLLRYLGENPPWESLGALFGEPWLGTTLVGFYRPVSTLIFAAEGGLFGSWAAGYHGLHTGVHALNTVLVYRLLAGIPERPGRGAPGSIALAAALLFGLYPLHPNAVLFAASFATLFAATFWLASVLAYRRYVEDGDARAYGASLLCYLLALGSYEVSAVLPVVLFGYDALLADRGRDRSTLRGITVRLLPFAALTGAYFLVRRAVLGVFLGGYPAAADSLSRPVLATLASDLVASVHRLHLPDYGARLSTGMATLTAAIIVAVAVVACLRADRRAGSGYLRAWVFAWVWTLATLAPFAFVPVVPGNGRYWYLPAVGIALGITLTIRALLEGASGRWPWRVGVCAFGLFWLLLLVGNLTVYLEAGDTARRIQEQLVGLHRQSPSDRILLTGYPQFLQNERGTNLAQVFHYGLADAVSPPFVPVDVPVYPLPPLRGGEIAPLFRDLPGAAVYRYDPAGSTVSVSAPPAGSGDLSVLDARGPRGRVAPRALDDLGVRVPGGTRGELRLLLLAEGNSWVSAPARSMGPGPMRLPLPGAFVRAMHHFYRSDLYWWVEARDGGRVVGASRVRTFRVGPGTAASRSVIGRSRGRAVVPEAPDPGSGEHHPPRTGPATRR